MSRNNKSRLFYYISSTVFVLHGLMLTLAISLTPYKVGKIPSTKSKVIRIVSLNNLGIEDEKEEGGILATKSLNETSNIIRKKAFSKLKIDTSDPLKNTTILAGRKKVITKSLKELTLSEVGLKTPKAIKSITLKGREILELGRNTKNIFNLQDEFSGLDMKRVDIHVPPPKGISKTDFDKVENKFYSFQRRVAVKYVNSLLIESRKFQETLSYNSRKELDQSREKLILEATITYDKNGDIERIKLNKNTKVYQIQNFWEKLLSKLDRFPNPPKEYQDQGTFDVVFQLSVDTTRAN